MQLNQSPIFRAKFWALQNVLKSRLCLRPKLLIQKSINPIISHTCIFLIALRFRPASTTQWSFSANLTIAVAKQSFLPSRQWFAVGFCCFKPFGNWSVSSFPLKCGRVHWKDSSWHQRFSWWEQIKVCPFQTWEFALIFYDCWVHWRCFWFVAGIKERVT